MTSPDTPSSMTMTSQVSLGTHSKRVARLFDIDFDGTTQYTTVLPPSSVAHRPGIGMIVGPSGTGKTTLLRWVAALKGVSEEDVVEWRDGPSAHACPRIVDEFTSNMDRICGKGASVLLRARFDQDSEWR